MYPSKNASLPANADDDRQVGLRGHVEVLSLAGDSSQANAVLLLLLVLADVLLGALENLLALLLLLLLVENEGARANRSVLGILLPLLEQSLGYFGQNYFPEEKNTTKKMKNQFSKLELSI